MLTGDEVGHILGDEPHVLLGWVGLRCVPHRGQLVESHLAPPVVSSRMSCFSARLEAFVHTPPTDAVLKLSVQACSDRICLLPETVRLYR